jgi:hypothetical protein
VAEDRHQLCDILRQIGHDELKGESTGPLMEGIELLSKPFASIRCALPLALCTPIFHTQKYTTTRR